MNTIDASKDVPEEEDPSAPPEDLEGFDPSQLRQSLIELIARHGHVDDDHREAYDELINDADRAALGGRTRSLGVLRNAVSWAVKIDEAITKYPAQTEQFYSKVRYLYLLDRALALADAIQQQADHRSGQGGVRLTAGDRETAAREARTTLSTRLASFAGRRALERAALDAATGRTDDATALGASIKALAALGDEWLSRKDPKAQIHCASARLSREVIKNARTAAMALTEAAASATLAGARPASDSPEVNLIEGSVLFEMEEVSRCFAEAHKRTHLLPRLTPGKATRGVLGPRRASKKVDPAVSANAGASTAASPGATPTNPGTTAPEGASAPPAASASDATSHKSA